MSLNQQPGLGVDSCNKCPSLSQSQQPRLSQVRAGKYLNSSQIRQKLSCKPGPSFLCLPYIHNCLQTAKLTAASQPCLGSESCSVVESQIKVFKIYKGRVVVAALQQCICQQCICQQCMYWSINIFPNPVLRMYHMPIPSWCLILRLPNVSKMHPVYAPTFATVQYYVSTPLNCETTFIPP